MKKSAVIAIVVVCLFCFVVVPVFFHATPVGKSLWNNWFYTVQKADDDTNYSTLKRVEDTCRSMIASYNSDKLTYEQYKSSDDAEKLGWAEQAKIRANKTASTYNHYILQNRYVWKNNIPADIDMELLFIE